MDKIVQHFLELIAQVSLNQLIGYIFMCGLLSVLMYILIKRSEDLWGAVKGPDGKLEMPEAIIAVALLLYIAATISDIFLGLKASEAVFWSINGMVFYALTHRVFMPKTMGNVLSEDEKETEDKSEKDEGK